MLRPVRRDRRFGSKSDPIDADAAAGAVLSGKATAVPKAGDAGVEMVRALKIAKQTAIKARTQAVNAVKGLVVMAPDPIREQLRNLKTPALVRTCSAYRVDRASDPTSAIKLSLRSMCRRYVALDQEVRSLEKELDALTVRLVPQLRQLFGVGQDVAATLLLAAGNSADRLRSEACNDRPVPAICDPAVTRRQPPHMLATHMYKDEASLMPGIGNRCFSAHVEPYEPRRPIALQDRSSPPSPWVAD